MSEYNLTFIRVMITAGGPVLLRTRILSSYPEVKMEKKTFHVSK